MGKGIILLNILEVGIRQKDGGGSRTEEAPCSKEKTIIEPKWTVIHYSKGTMNYKGQRGLENKLLKNVD